MKSWLEGVDASGFSLANLPIGIFQTDDAPRPGVALGDYVVDLSILIRDRLLDDETLLDARTLNAFLGHGPGAWQRLRSTLQRLYSTECESVLREGAQRALVPRAGVTMALPFAVQDYVDFYSSIEHATNLGRILRPTGEALLPNYRYVPIGYHGRAASIVVDGTDIHRPDGQRKPPDAASPTLGPTRQLDFELELGFVLGVGNRIGEPIPIDAVREHVYGYVVLNDWSARDIQGWEYQPLGPFLSKSFATSISPWIVSLDALEPFRIANREQDPAPLAYLHARENYAYDIACSAELQSAAMRAAGIAPQRISATSFGRMYWNLAQQLAHMTVNGSHVRTGDLYGSGTISGEEPGTYGSMIELTWRGAHPLTLPTGETRAFLEDGDLVVLRAHATRDGLTIGFGEVRGTIVA